MTHRILLADPSDVVLLGLQSILKTDPTYEVIECTRRIDDLIQSLPQHQPDVLVCHERLDPARDVLTLVASLKKVSATKLVILGHWADGLLIRDLFACGINGYLYMADDITDCLLSALKTVLHNRPYLSPTANAEYLIAMQSPLRDWQLDATARTVLHLLAQGTHVSEIAHQMNASLRQIYWVRRKLRIRFGAITNEHMMSRAAAEGFLARDD